MPFRLCMYGTCFPDYAYLLPARSSQFTIHKFQKRGVMPIPRFSAALIAGLIVSAACAPKIFAQTPSSNSGPAVQAKETKLEHFDPALVDKSLDACNDFYKYSCSKWLTANPIPPDQVFWSTCRSRCRRRGICRPVLDRNARAWFPWLE